MELEVLKDARVLAGPDGLGRKITSVTVGEVPDIADWLSGGEMVLSTLFAVRGDVERQREFCRRVMMSGAAALFVKTTRFVEAMPADVIELANKRKFPIIEVPQGLRWTRLMQDATEVIINIQASQLERSQAIHRSLLGVVIRGGGWQELADESSRLLEKTPVVFLDASLEVLSASSGVPELADLEKALHTPQLRDQFSTLGRSGKLFHLREADVPTMFVLPVVAGHQSQGYMCALSDAPELSAIEMTVLEHSATIATLEIAQDRVRFETEVRLRGDFVDEVISGSAATTDSLLRRGAFLRCDLTQGATVVLLGVDEFEGLIPRRVLDQDQLEKRVERFFSRCSRYVSASEASSLVSLKSGHVVVFLCGKTAQDPTAVGRMAQVLQGFGKTEAGLSISVGIGGFVPEPTQMDRGYQEALVALKVGRKLTGLGSFLRFSDVGTYRLLLDVWERDPDQVRSLYEETIGPVDRYDEANGTQLTKTLITFLANDESLIKTASDLYAHRHTVRYRLEKIAEISGLSVFKTEHKERLGLGLKARSLFLS
ncbi:MAG TPA: PucR family transcriptional regulator ligand-binding domain-containing protein [Thermoleophilia bacterium]|nr:PucR family transcriptional regulator ligand-binding domain-containing protein [Thermoleophilia bacterium]